MSKLPKYFIMQVWEVIDEHINIEGVLNYFTGEDKFSIIQKIYDNSFINDEIKENLRNNRKRRNQTKKRWVQGAIKDYKKPNTKSPKELTEEYKFLKSSLENYGETGFQEFFRKQTPEEVIEERIEILQNWCNDTNSYLSNYFYMKKKADSQIEKAVVADIVIIIGDLLMKKYDGNIQDVIIEKPYSYVSHPIFSEGRGKLDLSEDTIKQDMSNYRYNDFNPTSEYTLRILVAQEYSEKKQVGLLDNTDEKIFSEVLKYRNELFATQRKVVVEIGQIVKNLFKSKSVENYKLVQERLLKMVNMKFNVFHKGGILVFGLFETLKIDYNTEGWVAEVTVNDHIYQEYLNNQTIRMYKDSIKRFELPLSRSLIFALQKERFLRYSQNKSYEQVYSYNFFASVLRFKNGNRKDNYNQLKAALEEIVEHGAGIKSFAYEGDKFKIEYIPVTQYEVEDLLHSPSQMTHLLGFETSAQLSRSTIN